MGAFAGKDLVDSMHSKDYLRVIYRKECPPKNDFLQVAGLDYILLIFTK
jgi:hypothetical protein